jgi:glycosyltransferase involved in cell wall biosynthesis
MRVLVAHCFYRVAGGEDRHVLGAVELLRLQHDVSLLARRNQDLRQGFGPAMRMTWSPTVTDEVDRELQRFRPDVVHLHNAYPALGPAVHLAAARRGIPLVMTVHNQRLRCPNGLQFTAGARCRRCQSGVYLHAVTRPCFQSRSQACVYAASLWLHRFGFRLEDRIRLFITPSRFMRNRLSEWNIPADRVITVRHFTEPRPDASPDVGSYGLYLGRLSAEKGLPELLQALRIIGDPPFHVVGSGPLEGDLRRLADELGLTRTRFLGLLDRAAVQQALRGARYLALPSLSDESSGLAAMEAMAEGRPLLVSVAGALPELIRDGGGLTWPQGEDIATLAANLRRLVDDDRFCREAGARALEFSRRELTPASHLRGLEAAYATAMGGR